MLFQILSDRGQPAAAFQQAKGDGGCKNYLQRLLIGSGDAEKLSCRQSHQGEGLQLPRQPHPR